MVSSVVLQQVVRVKPPMQADGTPVKAAHQITPKSSPEMSVAAISPTVIPAPIFVSAESPTLPAAPVFAGAMRPFTLISDSGVEQAEPGPFTPHGKRSNEVLSPNEALPLYKDLRVAVDELETPELPVVPGQLSVEVDSMVTGEENVNSGPSIKGDVLTDAEK